MRFFKDGPSIPDALLEECDQGRVVFLCGAGVSIPSGMPSFYKLTKYVVDFFAPPEGSEIADAFATWTKNDDDGLRVPLDQIFNLLHQEYGRDEVNALVAKLLSRHSNSKSDHKHGLIARISSDLEGNPQIVTTNFDRLFDRCLRHPKDISVPPSLPAIELGIPVHGVTYLHGQLQKPDSPNHDYILSSADFGRAYLSEGWATNFVKALLTKYTVVLIGYQAKDPPVNYLLQGLNHDGKRDHSNLYAFDEGAHEDIEVKWRDRGVRPISYSGHSTLWKTLEAWADRADDPRTWRSGVVEMAKQNPRNLHPHERGKVAHLVRTAPGAKLFAEAEPSPHVEWLCVFDATCRAAKKSKGYREGEQEFDPLEAYGLDNDPERPPVDSKSADHRNELDYDQFLEWLPRDTNPPAEHSLANRQIQGREVLPPRLRHLLHWSSKYLNDPCLAWWATRRAKLHPRHIERIRWQLSKESRTLHPKARDTWNLILEAMSDSRRSDWDTSQFKLAERIKFEKNWSPGIFRAFDKTMAPILSYRHPFHTANTKPPDGPWDDISIKNFIEWEVKFHEEHGRYFEIPNDVLREVFSISERHLLRASELYHDIGATPYFSVPTCYPDREVDGDELRGNDDTYFYWFLGLIRRMSEQHPKTLKSHVLNWNHKDPFYFRKLKLFVLNDQRVFEASEAADMVLEFSRDELWDDVVAREVLFLLADRWNDFTKKQRNALVDRLLAGPEKKDYWPDEEYPSIRDTSAASYTKWLELNGCALTKGQSARLSKMISKIPEWKDGWAHGIVIKHGVRGGLVKTDDDPRSLLHTPVGKIIERAKSESGRDIKDFTDIQPFDGLVKQFPRKALTSLSHKKRQKIYPEEFWESLVRHWPEDISSPLTRLNRVFLYRVATLPPETIQAVKHPLSDYIKHNLDKIYATETELAWLIFDVLATVLVSKVETRTESGVSTFWSNGEVTLSSRRTIGHAINSPIGKITEGLCSALNSLKSRKSSGIPTEFKNRLERLIAAPSVNGDHSIAIVTRQINWLYYLDPDWVINRVMPWFDFQHPAAEPTWNGYLSAANLPPREIGKMLKPRLLEIFPTIYQWSWDQDFTKIAAQIIVELAIFRCNKPDGLSTNEARQCIRNMTDRSRREAIFRLKTIGQRKKINWNKHVVPFIENVWPRERKFKTTEMVWAWVHLLTAADENFPEVLKCVRRFLVPVRSQNYGLHSFFHEFNGKKPLTTKHPKAVLDMFDAITPEDPQGIQHDLASVLNLIEETDPRLTKDRRYYRLLDLVENL